MDVLRRNILPDLLARRWTERSLKIWSAGCSTGEEPYTLAILLRQVIPDIDRWKISILATDINRNALHQATLAKYRDWSFRQSGDSQLIQAYFTRSENDYLLKPVIKEMVKFAYLNIAEDTFPSQHNGTDQVDLILCRNVTIYFSEAVIQQAAKRFYQSLSPGGWLMLAPSEANDQVYHQFHAMRFEKAILYQKLSSVGVTETQWNTPNLKEFTGQKQSIPIGIHPVERGSTDGVQNVEPQVDLYFSHTPPVSPVEKRIFPKEFSSPQSTSEKQVEENLSLYRKALELMKQRDYEGARKYFVAYLQHNPVDMAAQVQFALMEANAGRNEAAQDLARSVIKNDPLNIEAYYIIALVHQENGEVEAAVTSYKKVLYISPDHILAHYNLANLYLKQGQPKDSSRHHNQAVSLASKLHPDDILPGSDDLSISDFLKMAHR